GVGLVALLVLSVGLAFPLCGLSHVGRGHAGRNVAGGSDGIHLTLPVGWNERVTYDSTLLGPSLYASDRSLPSESLEYPGWSRFADGLGPGDVLLSLHEFVGVCPCSGFAVLHGPPALERA